MIPSPYSIDGFVINDGTNYRAYWPESTIYLGPSSSPNIAPRAYYAPEYVNSIRESSLLPLHIIMLGDIPTQSDELRGKLNPIGQEVVPLILHDLDNSDEPWVLYVNVRKFDRLVGPEYTVLLDVPDMVRKRVATTSATVSKTSSPATRTVTPGGNYQTNPVMTFKPTSAKGGSSFPFQWFVKWLNNTTNVFSKYGFDLGSDAFNTAALITDPVHTNQLNGAIDAVVTTINIDTPVGGGVGWNSTAGMGMIDSEQISWTNNTGSQLTGVTRGIGGTSAASHLDNATLSFSYMQANGADLRVYIDGSQVDRWFDGFNTTTTKIWVNVDSPSRAEFTISAAISGVGLVSTVGVNFPNATYGSAAAFDRLPSSGIFIVDSEIFTYTGRTASSFTNCARAAKLSSAAAHSIGATLKVIPHDIWLYSGDASLTAQVVNDNNKPMFDLDTSTNASLVYTSFFDANVQRPNAWSVVVQGQSAGLSAYQFVYTALNGAQANPATAIGFANLVYLSNGKYYYPGGNIYVTLVSPVSINTITATGEKKRQGTPWFSAVNMFASGPSAPNGNTLWSEVAPTSGAGFVAWSSHSGVAANGATYLRLTINAALNNGTVGAVNGSVYAAMDSITLAMTSADIPTVSISPLNSSYDLNATVANDVTGDSISFRVNMPLNATLTVNTEEHIITLDTDNSTYPVTLNDPSRFDWLPLKAGVVNTLTLTDPGLAGLDWGLSFNDRMI